MNFTEAINHVHMLEARMSPGSRVLHKVHVDPRKRENEALVDLCSVFLDRGAAKWAPKFRNKGFLYFFASLEGLGYAPWRKHARVTAKRILAEWDKCGDSQALAESILQENLDFFGVPQESWAFTIRSMLLKLRGWAGMFHRMETHPDEAPENTRVRFIDYCAVQSIIARSSIEDLCRESGWDDSTPFASWMSDVPQYRHTKHKAYHTSAIAYVDQNSNQREALEREFKYQLLHAIGEKPIPKDEHRPSLQLYTCIDDRECSFRRHVEDTNPRDIETFGVAGFFGIPIRYHPADGRNPMALAPEGHNPPGILVEAKADQQQAAKVKQRRRIIARLALWWESASFSPIGSVLLSCLFPVSLTRLLLMGFSPTTKRLMKERFLQAVLPKPQTIFQIPFPPEQAAKLLAGTFKEIGTHNRFAPIVLVLGHGSSSVNNPFAAAYNCGACGGREGGPNARLLARLANDRDVRLHLFSDHGIRIPDDTAFIGGLHNTTSEEVEFYDIERLPQSHAEKFVAVKHIIEVARRKNALERCRRFLLAEHVHTPEEALLHVQTRSADAAEVRPELNHATNAAVVIGRRELTKGRFLDRRVFLPSYDPLSDDDAGTNLEHVLAPALLVCSGINLEYLFSTIDEQHAAGTKAPLNIVGNIGVLQGTTGDLRPGLPSQMTEMHTPIRALFVVDAPINRVEAVLARREELRQLVRNDWVRFVVRDPETGRFFKQLNGEYLSIDFREITMKNYPPFTSTRHYHHAKRVARQEAFIYWAAVAGMGLACGLPIYTFGLEAMNPRGPLIALCATLISLPVLAFARRYLHGEFMFGRFSALCVGMLLGFNLVATAPSIEHAMAGWGLFGFASTFLIGAYNDRPTVRNNALYAFSAYRISDFALLVAAAFSSQHVIGASPETQALVAAGLLVAALFKSSQFPLVSLFARSMEGPTPASALGYAGLSAHVGIVLLVGTMPVWFGFGWARVALGSVGIITAVYASLIEKIRADRKGAIANATSATLGIIFVILALGYSDLALVLALGHAAFRMTQILRAPNVITDTQKLRSALGYMPWPKVVPDWLYRLSWSLHRCFSADFHLLHVLHKISRPVYSTKPWELTRFQQWSATGAIVTLAGAPFTPLSHYLEEFLMELLPTQPYIAGGIIVAHFGLSVILMRFLFLNVLNARRFHRKHRKYQLC